MYTHIGIDLGASTVAVSTPGEGILSLVRAPMLPEVTRFSVAGDAALQGHGSVGEGSTSTPVFRENIVIPEYTAAMIKAVLDREDVAPAPTLLLGIPCSFSEVEESALVEMALGAGAGTARLVYSPLAALVGNGLDPGMAAIVVDIGAARTDILVMARGRIVYKKTHRVGGIDFDAAIVRYAHSVHRVAITPETAERVKAAVGTVWIGDEKRAIEVSGRDITNGDYCTVRIISEEMFTALEEPTATLIEGICTAITRIPPDLVREIFDTGILLSGGTALLEGLDKMISGVTGVNAARMNDPIHTVAEGLSQLAAEGVLGGVTNGNITRYIMKAAAEGAGGK